jgi:hypothetical protein
MMMDASEIKIDRLLQEVAQLRERVDSIPTVADFTRAVIVGSLAIMAYNYIAIAYNYLTK